MLESSTVQLVGDQKKMKKFQGEFEIISDFKLLPLKSGTQYGSLEFLSLTVCMELLVSIDISTGKHFLKSQNDRTKKEF